MSINDRLGVALRVLAPLLSAPELAKAGQDITPLGNAWLNDIQGIAFIEAKRAEQLDMGIRPEYIEDEDPL